MDFIQSKSMGCSSVADLLLGAGGVGGEQMEGGAEGVRAAECIGAAAGFLDVIA